MPKSKCLILMMWAFLMALCFTILGTCLSEPFGDIFLWLTIIPTLFCLTLCWKYVKGTHTEERGEN